MATEKRLIDGNGRYTLHASDNTEYSLLFRNGIIGVENEMGHCVCEFHADDAPTVDAVEVVHAYWTGLTPIDYSFAEGFTTEMPPEERAKRHEDFMHTTHCSNCNGGFDDRRIKYFGYCPYCGAKMDGERKGV